LLGSPALGAGFDPEKFDLDAVNKRLPEAFEPKPSKKKSASRI
jgi:hypothetical protein